MDPIVTGDPLLQNLHGVDDLAVPDRSWKCKSPAHLLPPNHALLHHSVSVDAKDNPIRKRKR